MITVLTGANNYAITEALRVKTSAFHGDVERFDGLELEPRQLPDIFAGVSLFSPERMVVVRGASTNRSLWSELEKWIEKVPRETDIVMVEPSPDKRTKTYKLLQKHADIREHGELAEPALVAWIQAVARQWGGKLTPDLARYMVSYIGHDQWRLSNELRKLLLSEKPITRELIAEITEPYPEATAFELLDAVFAGNQARVTELLDLLRQREDPYQFFGLLSSQVAALLALVYAGVRRPDEVAKDMGVHPFVVKKLSSAARSLGKGRVERLVQQLAQADMKIKSSAEPWQQLEITLLSI